MESVFKEPKLLVTGAGGNLGHRVVEILHENGYTNLIAATRNPYKLNHFIKKGIEVRKVDFDDPNTLQDAFMGIDRLLLISTDALHVAGQRINQHRAAVLAAKLAGVKHIVYTSMPHPEKAQNIPFAIDHVVTEKEIESSGIEFTILRNSWYAENLIGFLPQILTAGKWPTVSVNGKIAYIPREDVAQATASALIKSTGKDFVDITGESSLSINEIAAIASSVFNKEIEVVQVLENKIHDDLVAIGIPLAFVPTVVMTDLNTSEGNFDIITNEVQKLSGKAPDNLRDFFLNNRKMFLKT